MIHVQVLLAAKGIDAVAVTALGALRTLLGFGDTLAGLERRRIFELTTEGAAPEVVRALESYLQRTFEFWNPNKERCWIRTADSVLEVVPGQAPRARTLSVDGDHLLVWSLPTGADAVAGSAGVHAAAMEAPAAAAGGASVPSREVAAPRTTPAPSAGEGLPRDFPARLGESRVTARRGEVYTFHWADAPDDASRTERVERAGAVRRRGAGLLVQPQYQASRVVLGVLPWPAWEVDAER